MRPHIKAVLSVVVFFVTLFVTSCVSRGPLLEPTITPIPTVVEPGLAYGIPCKPPCWQGLVPGESTRLDVEQAMEQLRTSGWAHFIDAGPPGGYFIYPSPFTIHGSIHVAMNDNDIVAAISGTTLFYYPIGTLIEQFGNPEGLYVVSRGSVVCFSCEEWEHPEPPDASVMSSPVHILYPSQGLWFVALVPLSGLGCICPEMKVVSFCYYSPRSMREALSDEYLTTLFVALKGATEEDLTEWHGFGGGY